MNAMPASRRFAAIVIAAALTVGGCGAAAPTPQIIYVTPVPTPSPIIIYVTPPPTPTPAATSSPEATATPTSTATANPSPTSRAAACTGTAANKAFFVDAAANLPFDVYCAALPSKWWLQNGGYELPDGGNLHVTYGNASGGFVVLSEGAWCAGAGPTCSYRISVLGSASFGGMAGELVLTDNAPITYALYVAPSTTHAYSMTGTGMSQSQFVAWAAAVVKVPRS